MLQMATKTANVKPTKIDVFSPDVKGGKREGIIGTLIWQSRFVQPNAASGKGTKNER